MINELWKHSSIAQELLAEGREEGRKEGALQVTRSVLERRIGKLDEKVVQALEQMDIATLEELAADATLTREQLKARLGIHP